MKKERISSSGIRSFSLYKGLKTFSKKLYNEAFVKIFYGGGLMKTEIIITVVIILGMVILIDKIYGKINIENYSPIWEYFSKALLYGFIASITLFYEKESLRDVNALEWAIIAVSIIEGTGNYINYVKESKRRKKEKRKT